MLLALLWAGWHLPLFFYPGWISATPWIYILIMIGASIIMTYGANLAHFSVMTPIVMHATFNTASRFLNGLFAGTVPSPYIPFELVLALSGLGTAVVLILATRGSLAYREDSALG